MLCLCEYFIGIEWERGLLIGGNRMLWILIRVFFYLLVDIIVINVDDVLINYVFYILVEMMIW